MIVKWMKVKEGAMPPEQAYEDDAGFDLRAAWCQYRGTYIEYGTGIALEIPPGYVGLLFPRSSISDMDVSLTNSVGVVDSGFRGEVTFRFRPLYSAEGLQVYSPGDRIGQLLIVKLPDVVMMRAYELSPSHRGERGYGSSGK